jgi:adenosylmethionine---8-amino-7-oxononanoate aminotransferase
MITPQDIQFDKDHVWHPYSKMQGAGTNPLVIHANGCELTLADGQTVIDGMASWWAAIHGYNHPELNKAAEKQISCFSHVMFGGLTHEPAIRLAQRLVTLTPEPLNHVFFSDSGSVAVEVAMKMAIQYWVSLKKTRKQSFFTFRQGYHGDTFATMSLSDPDSGMHQLFGNLVSTNRFLDAPPMCSDIDMEPNLLELETYCSHLRSMFEKHHEDCAALIIEPIVQGAGGMRFYHPKVLQYLRTLCDEFDVLLVLDEIATGFGRTGELFAHQHANVVPDILCLGKALTGGYLTLAATLSTTHIAQSISENPPHAFMHGPTFMANPLACAIADTSIGLLLESGFRTSVRQVETWLKEYLYPLSALEQVKDVRVLGAIGVVELASAVDVNKACTALVAKGVWLRPYLNLIYCMPPFVISEQQVQKISVAIEQIILDQQI